MQNLIVTLHLFHMSPVDTEHGVTLAIFLNKHNPEHGNEQVGFFCHG